MRGQDCDKLIEGELISAAMNILTVKYVEDLKSAGYGNPGFLQILEARSHNITPSFIRDTKLKVFKTKKTVVIKIVRAVF